MARSDREGKERLSRREYFSDSTRPPQADSDDCERYGRFKVPGEEILELPAGAAHFYFGLEGPVSGGVRPIQEHSGEVAVTDESTGKAVPIRYKPRDAQQYAHQRGLARAYVGRVEIPHPGRYKVSFAGTAKAGPEEDEYLAVGARDPVDRRTRVTGGILESLPIVGFLFRRGR